MSSAQLLKWHVVSRRPFSHHCVCNPNWPLHLYGYSQFWLLMIPGHSLPPKSYAYILLAPSITFAPTMGLAQYLCSQESLFMHMHMPAARHGHHAYFIIWPLQLSMLYHFLVHCGQPHSFCPQEQSCCLCYEHCLSRL